MTHPLHGFTAPEPILVLADAGAPPPPFGEVVEVASLNGSPVKRGQKSVLLVTADRASLRRLASALPRLGQVRVVACWLHAATSPLVVAPRPEWPALTSAMAREADQGVLTVLRFAAPVPAHQVLAEMARQAVPAPLAAGSVGHGGLVASYAGRPAAAGLDPRAVLLGDAADAGDSERDVPPDVVVVRDDRTLAEGSVGVPSSRTIPAHHVIGRAPTVVTEPGVEPVDELVVNPRGWRKDWEQPVADAAGLGLGDTLREADLPRLRALQGVAVRLGETPSRLVAALAMSGVPLLAEGDDPRLADTLRKALAERPDLDDPLAREEHSVTTRRAALRAHSTLAWRESLAAQAGVRFVAQPKVSVLLATVRPHQLDFALRQIARQRDADLELVVSTHGFAADPAHVRAALGDRPFTLLDHPADAFFGDVLDAAASAATGDVLLKVDDDDWYSPHVVGDLLLARRYSGAEVVGMPSEFVYLQELGVTAQRNHPTEVFNRFVAGGTIMIDRQVLRSVGGFRRVRRFVDAQLLDAVQAAGGSIYRAHGLGYVLRRTGSGHTWQSDPESFRRPEILARQWPGFHASRELEVDERDLP
ncbi:hypothetical protein DDE18_00910 [Nocardioides gansuensis]|uniref:Glycosyl transferase family 2 n=1 Tax=Nocardioides gansuensis TaxID=2138300 RepID=A0A2T8FEW7_9ACTN|nr:hypothetical protein [Nocardioides gansuensis]PVG84230.1 hypothetical protein DDE18_00910 [Nocardioides gansuensis]